MIYMLRCHTFGIELTYLGCDPSHTGIYKNQFPASVRLRCAPCSPTNKQECFLEPLPPTLINTSDVHSELLKIPVSQTMAVISNCGSPPLPDGWCIALQRMNVFESLYAISNTHWLLPIYTEVPE
jgi:hypothetical protein